MSAICNCKIIGITIQTSTLHSPTAVGFTEVFLVGWLIRSGLDIQRLQCGGRTTDHSSLGQHLPESCGAGARDSGAEKDGC